MKFERKESYTIDDLREIMKILRSDEGCPWDREQDHQSIRKNFLEETYEVLEAIDEQDTELLKEELGDVLMQVVFHARMEEELHSFDLNDVITGVCKKLVDRHPHVFGDVKADTSEQVLKNWDAIKKEEKKQESYTATLEQVPKVLPALMRAEKVQQRAARVGIDIPTEEAMLSSLEDQVAELYMAMQSGDLSNINEEIGDILFSCVNLSRFFKLDSEKGLTNATEKFINRFRRAETLAAADGVEMTPENSDALSHLWNLAKVEKDN